MCSKGEDLVISSKGVTAVSRHTLENDILAYLKVALAEPPLL